MNFYINIFKKSFLLTMFAISIWGCKKELNDYSFNPPRQFTPGNIRILAGEVNVALEWNASLFTNGTGTTYTVEIGQDSAFAAPGEFSLTTPVPNITVSDSVLAVRTRYFARVRANATETATASFWITSNSFQISGEQILSSVLDSELTDSSAVLRWRPTPNLTRIVITPLAGTAFTVNLTPADLAANFKQITGLTESTTYTAEIFQGNLTKGTMQFTTKEKSEFTIMATPADNLVEIVANAAPGSVIGLASGTYNLVDPATQEYVRMFITEKTITLASVTNNPADVQVNFNEITLRGTGAGVNLRGITFDGLAAGNNSLYFLNLVGLNSDGQAASFSVINVDNCVVKNFGNCFFRGNRAGNNAHKLETFKVNNSIIGDNRTLNAYSFFTMDKMEFNTLELTNSTFYKIGRGFVLFSTNITLPNTPKILIDRCTINGFGRDGRNQILVDANANTVDLEISNSIIGNAPMEGQTTGASLIRANSATSAVLVHSNLFKLSNGMPTPADLTLPSNLVTSNNLAVDLGWNPNTTNFTLPAGSPLRTASSSNGPIGDPRWAF